MAYVGCSEGAAGKRVAVEWSGGPAGVARTFDAVRLFMANNFAGSKSGVALCLKFYF